jgi:putative endonuclease
MYSVYILECADHSYYIGVTSNLDKRVAEHQQKTEPSCYTASRLPVTLKYVEQFQHVHEALQREKQLKGWSRKKKEALIQENWNELKKLSKSYSHASTSSA